MEHLKSHVGHYISLTLIFSVSLFLILMLSPYKDMQLVIVLLTAFFYVVWGLLHHKLNHELNRKIVIEYVLIGLLGVGIVYFLMTGGTGI